MHMKVTLAATLLLAGVAGVSGQEMALRGSTTDLITFERWCGEVANMPASRCDTRRPDDYDAFRVYRQTVERYEADFMRQRDAEYQLMRRLDTQDTLVPTSGVPE